LSKIAPNFGHFALPNFVGGTACKISVHPLDNPGLEPRPLVKFREVTPTTPNVIGAHMWNFKPNFKCSPLKFLRGPRPGLWCALASLRQTLARIKISVANTP